MKYKCRSCDEQFDNKSYMMRNIKQKHPNFVRPCRYNADGKCSFTADLCWYKHITNQTMKLTNENTFLCFTCQEGFKTKKWMMEHRKINHPENVRPCSKYLAGECEKCDKSCWFIHKQSSSLGFQKSQNNQLPP